MAFEGFKSWTEKLKEKSKEAETIEFKNFDEAEKEVESVKAEEVAAEPARSVVGATDSTLELKVVRPESLAEVSTIADYLLDNCTVVLNLELLDEASTTRMLDFLNGVTYTNGGDIKNVSQGTYIITPSGININK